METTITSKKTQLVWLWLSLFVILLDQITKHLVTAFMLYGESIPLISFFNFTLVHNTGAAFSFMSATGMKGTLFFICVALISSIVLCLWMRRLSPQNYWLSISLALILGGAVANLLDRILHGYVIDFLHFHLGGWSFPVFNVADIAISIGAAMLVLDIFRRKS